jgi:hypothetical protein
MYATGGRPMFGSPQENSNRAWQKLAKELGFIWDTVKPIPGKHMRYFTAEDPLFRESML